MRESSLIADKEIEDKIYLIRSYKVMLDSDLAELYFVKTFRLNEQVKRNLDRFPKDFMFQLTPKEWTNLISQNAISSSWGGRRTPPYVFTEHSVLMLSGILNSERAVQVNIQIMRIDVKLREIILTNKEILLKLEQMEKNTLRHDGEIKLIFEYLKGLLNPVQPPRKRIGYRGKEDEEFRR
jgi:hypothetical protein